MSRHKNGISKIVLSTYVPLTTAALAVEQAHTEHLNLSQFLAKVLLQHLKDQGTTISA